MVTNLLGNLIIIREEGIVNGINCAIANCSASENVASGIVTADNCSVLNCTACGNEGTGIIAQQNATRNLLNCGKQFSQ